jgi:hypothetical protein
MRLMMHSRGNSYVVRVVQVNCGWLICFCVLPTFVGKNEPFHRLPILDPLSNVSFFHLLQDLADFLQEMNLT